MLAEPTRLITEHQYKRSASQLLQQSISISLPLFFQLACCSSVVNLEFISDSLCISSLRLSTSVSSFLCRSCICAFSSATIRVLCSHTLLISSASSRNSASLFNRSFKSISCCLKLTLSIRNELYSTFMY